MPNRAIVCHCVPSTATPLIFRKTVAHSYSYLKTDFYKNISPHLKFNKTIGENMPAEQTVELIIKTVNTYSNSDYIKKVVQILDKGNPTKLEFLKRLFDIACINVKYLRDPEGNEIIFTPKLLMQVGKGDCKKFTTFILSVLKCKGITGVAKVVSYDGISWEHIYAIVPLTNDFKDYITLDPVNHCKYNSEVEYKKAQLFNLNGTKSNIMNGNKLSLMGSLGNLNTSDLVSGISDASADFLGDIDQSFNGFRKHGPLKSMHDPEALSGLGNDYINGTEDEIQINGTDDIGKKKTKEQKTANRAKRKTKRKKIFSKVKKAGFAVPRAAFLGLIMLGGALAKTKVKFNLAAKLAQFWQKDNGAQLTTIWEKFGGKKDALKKAIAKGAKTQLNGQDIEFNRDGSFQLNGIGVVTAAAVGGSITAAAPILIAVVKMLKKDKIVSENEGNNVEAVVDNAPAGDLKETFKEPLLTAAKEFDGGGNPETQKEIIKEAAKEAPVSEGDTTNFKAAAAKGGGSAATSQSSSNPRSDSYADNNSSASSSSSSNSTAENTEEKGLVPAEHYKTAKSIISNWRSPLTWLKAYLLLVIFAQIHTFNFYVLNGLHFAVIAMLIFTILNLIIKKTKYHYEQI